MAPVLPSRAHHHQGQRLPRSRSARRILPTSPAAARSSSDRGSRSRRHAGGEPSDRVDDEDTPVSPIPDKASRRDQRVGARAALDGVRSVVLCTEPDLWHRQGRAQGEHRGAAADRARPWSGVDRHDGRGATSGPTSRSTIWSTSTCSRSPRPRRAASSTPRTARPREGAGRGDLPPAGFGGRSAAIALEDAVRNRGGSPRRSTFGSTRSAPAGRAPTLAGGRTGPPARRRRDGSRPLARADYGARAPRGASGTVGYSVADAAGVRAPRSQSSTVGKMPSTMRSMPAAEGWMPSRWLRSGSPATPSRKNG